MADETRRFFEIIMLLGRAPTNVNPDDSTSSGYEPGTPNVYQARLI